MLAVVVLALILLAVNVTSKDAATSPQSYPSARGQQGGYPPLPPSTPAGQGLAAAVVIGCVVAVVLGVYGRLHGPAGFSINLAGFWFEVSSPRVAVDSLAGCLFYGAFVSKMLCLSRPNIPPKALPVLGGIVFTALIALWLMSSVWLFDTQGLKF